MRAGIAAAGGLAGQAPADAPHIILFPEIPFDEAAFLARVKQCVTLYEYCVRRRVGRHAHTRGQVPGRRGTKDAFGQRSSVASRPRWLSSCAASSGSSTTTRSRITCSARRATSRRRSTSSRPRNGKAAVELRSQARTPSCDHLRKSDSPYAGPWAKWRSPRSRNKEKLMPRNFITKDGFGIRRRAGSTWRRLIQGEDYPPYVKGLPSYVSLKNPAGCTKARERLCAKVAPAPPKGRRGWVRKTGLETRSRPPAPFFAAEASLV